MKTVKAFFTATIVILILGATALADSNQTEAIKWLGFDAAQQQGNPANDKYFIYFKSNNCGYCRKLESNAFSSSQIINYINENFIPVRVNVDQDPKLAKRYRVQGVPDLRFLSAEGEDIARWPGYTEADHLLALLKFVHTDSYKKMNFTDFVKSMSP